MHYVYLTNNVVTDQAQVDPFSIFAPEYAQEFIEAADEVTFGWILKDGDFVPPPGPTPDELKAECKAQAMSLLASTDWVNQPDVRDPANSPHLINAAEFDAYRLAVRQYAVYPVADPVWPTLPDEQWSN